MIPRPAYDRTAVVGFFEGLRARHGLTDPDPITSRPEPLTTADGTPEPDLPHESPEDAA